MPAMTTPQLVQMIVSLRGLQLQEAAQQLQREQMGIAGTSEFQNMLGGSMNPEQFSPYVSNFTDRTGLPADVLQTMIAQTPPKVETTRGGAAARGAQAAGQSLDLPTATTALTGMTPGQIPQDALSGILARGAADYYGAMSPQEQKGLHDAVLTKLGTGMDVGSATFAAAQEHFFKSNPSEAARAVEIGRGLAPNASETMQSQLGFANLRAQMRYQEGMLANETLRTQLALREGKSKLDGAAFTAADQLLEKRDALLQYLGKNSATVTKEGMQTFIEQLNGYNQQLRTIAPGVFGPGGSAPLADFPKGGSVGAQGLSEAIGMYLSGQVKSH